MSIKHRFVHNLKQKQHFLCEKIKLQMIVKFHKSKSFHKIYNYPY